MPSECFLRGPPARNARMLSAHRASVADLTIVSDTGVAMPPSSGARVDRGAVHRVPERAARRSQPAAGRGPCRSGVSAAHGPAGQRRAGGGRARRAPHLRLGHRAGCHQPAAAAVRSPRRRARRVGPRSPGDRADPGDRCRTPTTSSCPATAGSPPRTAPRRSRCCATSASGRSCIAGISVNIAIPVVATEAVDEDFDVVIATDAVAGDPPEHVASMMQYTLAFIARLSTVDELLAGWDVPAVARA